MALCTHLTHVNFKDCNDEFKSLLDSEIILTEGKDIPDPADFEILVNANPTEEWIEASSKLKAVVIPWAGIPQKTRKLMSEYPQINVHNLHYNNFNTAEMGLTLLLAAAKSLIPLDQALRSNDWTPRYEETNAIMLRDRTALILGFGEIGQALGAYCLGLGMKVMATKKHPNDYDGNVIVDIYPNEHLHDLLPKADVLLIALPLTEETEDLIGALELSLMPKGSILINIGRGAIVNQHALYDALLSGHLHSAGSDVWYRYPETEEERKNTSPADVPFGKLDNFVLSPHRGGFVKNSEMQRAQALAKLLNAANRGQSIPNQVNLEAGY